MKNQILLTVALFLSVILTGYSQSKITITEAINIAGKQRMLGQRMAKDKVFINANVTKETTNEELKKSFVEFEKGLELLTNFAPTEAIKSKTTILGYSFLQYKKQILDQSKESIKEVFASNTAFLKDCDKLVIELVKHSALNETKNTKGLMTEKVAVATESSGKLRYLTQRLTLYFAMNEFDYASVSPHEMNAIINDLDTSLKFLMELNFNTIEIKKSLITLTSNWEELKAKLYVDNVINMDPKGLDSVSLYSTCNNILDKANTTTEMYSKLH